MGSSIILERELPNGWIDSKLRDLFEIRYGKGLREEARNNKGSINVYGSNGVVGKHNKPFTKGPTIVIGRKGSVGEIQLSNEPCWPIDTTYFIDDFKENLPPEYWAHLLKSLNLGKHDKSSAIPGVNRDDVYNAEICLPPLLEQNRIVAKLDQILPRIKACKDRLEIIPQTIKRFRQAILFWAYSGGLTEVWRAEKGFAEWEQSILGENVVLITKGSSPKWQGINYSKSGILFVTSENVGVGKLLLENKKYLEPKFNLVQKRSILKKGDLLTNIVGASIGRTAIFDLDEVANVNQAVAIIRLKDSINKNFALGYLNSPFILEFFNNEKVDVARANISLKDLSEMPIPVPKLEEQVEIVRRVEALFTLADRLEAQYLRAKEKVDKLTQSVLAKAFRGELVPQNPSDEPASVLLERIRAQREANPRTSKRKRKKALVR